MPLSCLRTAWNLVTYRSGGDYRARSPQLPAGRWRSVTAEFGPTVYAEHATLVEQLPALVYTPADIRRLAARLLLLDMEAEADATGCVPVVRLLPHRADDVTSRAA